MDFEATLREETSGYDGDYSQLITKTADLYCITTALLREESLTQKERQLLISATAYLILPEDLYPEEIFGAKAYIDDCIYCRAVLKVIEHNHGRELLYEYWHTDLSDLDVVLEYEVPKLPGVSLRRILAYTGLSEHYLIDMMDE